VNKSEIIEKMRLTGHPSYPWLQCRLKVSYEEAKRICDGLDYRLENVYIMRMNEYLRKL